MTIEAIPTSNRAWVEYFEAKRERNREIGHFLLLKLREDVEISDDGHVLARDIVREVATERNLHMNDVQHALWILETSGLAVLRDGQFVAAEPRTSA
jgi:hypothetical protein